MVICVTVIVESAALLSESHKALCSDTISFGCPRNIHEHEAILSMSVVNGASILPSIKTSLPEP